MMRLRWILLSAGVLLAASAVAGVAQPRLAHSATASTKTITVTGTGKATVVPDRASLDFSVQTRAATAKAALAKNAEEAAAIIAAVKNAGVSADDIRTNYVSLGPQMNSTGTDITGYSATNTVTVSTTLAKAGAVIDAAVAAGANGVWGPNLSSSDEASLRRTALKNAVADAEDKAKALAAAAGLSMLGVQAIAEGTTQTPPIVYGAAPAGAVAKADASVPIEPGTQTTEATVTVTYNVG